MSMVEISVDTTELQTRREAIRENIEYLSRLTVQQKIRYIERRRKAIAFLKSLTENAP